jgi:hypothetical protein
MTKSKKSKEGEALTRDAAATYDEFKEFEGRRYTGMKVGRGHKWNYDPGVWKESKISPDEWRIEYAVTKRRKGHAPEGSGVPVGTGYHWYVIAHQNVTKLNANDYSTSLTGMKFKLAHKRADKDTWSASEAAQRRHMVKILRELADQLETQGVSAPSKAHKALPAGPGRTRTPRGTSRLRRGRPRPPARPRPSAPSRPKKSLGGSR